MRVYILVFTILFSQTYFFFNDTATTEIYTLSLHDALPIYPQPGYPVLQDRQAGLRGPGGADRILRIGPLQEVKRGGEVADRAAERTHVIEAAREERGARARHATVGRLEPEDAAE